MPDFFKYIKFQKLPSDQYYDEIVTKKSICLHHTAGGSAQSSIEGWLKDKVRVGTCVIIDRKDTIFQQFESDRWAFSLGLETANYKIIERQTINIELANYGFLIPVGKGRYKNAYGGYVEPKNVIELEKPYRGYTFYENYTDFQIDNTLELISYWKAKYNMNFADLKLTSKGFELDSVNALKGVGGLYTHGNFRADKTDIYPHPKFCEVLL